MFKYSLAQAQILKSLDMGINVHIYVLTTRSMHLIQAHDRSVITKNKKGFYSQARLNISFEP